MTMLHERPSKSASHNPAIGSAPSITTPLPGPIAKSLIDRDERYSSPSYTRDYPLVVKRAHGVVVEDVDGNRFLDFAAGIAVCATGHCHPDVVAAIEKQARELIHICGSDFYYPSMVELFERLEKITPGTGEKKVLLTNSGAEAVEAAFKLARHHTNRKYAISFHGAFHGRTMGALSLTSSKARQKEKFGPLVPMTAHVPFGSTKDIENVLFRYQMAPTEVAAIFVEAIQGEGGYVIAPDGFLKDLRALCDKHGILLVCDEIQSGTGRTGKWWAYEHFGIVPDITVVSKGLASGMPLGAVIASKGIMNWPPGAGLNLRRQPRRLRRRRRNARPCRERIHGQRFGDGQDSSRQACGDCQEAQIAHEPARHGSDVRHRRHRCGAVATRSSLPALNAA